MGRLSRKRGIGENLREQCEKKEWDKMGKKELGEQGEKMCEI